MKHAVIEEFERDGANLYLGNLFFNHLVIDADNILFFKEGEKIVIGKKNDYNNKPLYFCEKLEYSKPYLSVGFSNFGFCLKNYLLARRDEQAILLEKDLKSSSKNRIFNESEMSRVEVEEYFNHKNYDSMYLININKGVLFASNKKNGTIIDTKIVPSDEEIINLERLLRINSTITYNINNSRIYAPFIDLAHMQKKDIEEIKGISVYVHHFHFINVRIY